MTEIDIHNNAEISEYTYSNWTIENSTFSHGDFDFADFFNNFMLKNLPCIIKNVTNDWDCASKWVNKDEINYEYLIETYGDLDAPVADCQNIEYNSQSKNDMKVAQYMEYLKGGVHHETLYLKDWHLRRSKPDDLFYETPLYFVLDWLNEFALDKKKDDFMFVYIGPKGSWTPFHEDVYCSYSWSVNVVGRKKWILFPPGEENQLKDQRGNLPLLFEPEKYKNVKYFEIIQEKGDAIFVPSGWHHQVTNELDTISVNHNWINGCNIEIVWKAIQKTLSDVEKQIEEFKDTPEFETECQLILKSLFGMDCEFFVTFLCYIAKKRIAQLGGKVQSVSGKYLMGKNIIQFDLKNVLKVMNSICLHPIYLNKNILSSIEPEFLEIRKVILYLITDNKL